MKKGLRTALLTAFTFFFAFGYANAAPAEAQDDEVTKTIKELADEGQNYDEVTVRLDSAEVGYQQISWPNYTYVVRQDGAVMNVTGTYPTTYDVFHGPLSYVTGTVKLRVSIDDGFLHAYEIDGVTNNQNITYVQNSWSPVATTLPSNEDIVNHKGDFVALKKLIVHNTGETYVGDADNNINFPILTAEIGGKTYQLREDYNWSNKFVDGDAPYNLRAWYRDPDTLIVDEGSVQEVSPVKVTTDISGYATLYSSKQLYLPEGFTASTYNWSGNKLTLSRRYSAADTLYTILPAYEAVVVKAAPSTTYSLEVSTDQLTYETDRGEFDPETWERIGGNSLNGVSAETDLSTWNDTRNYFYAPKEGADGFGFFWANDKGEGFVAPANTVYLAVDKDSTTEQSFLLPLDIPADGSKTIAMLAAEKQSYDEVTVRFNNAKVVYTNINYPSYTYVVREDGKAINVYGTYPTSYEIFKGQGTDISGTVKLKIDYNDGWIIAHETANTNGDSIKAEQNSYQNVPLAIASNEDLVNHKGDLVALKKVNVTNTGEHYGDPEDYGHYYPILNAEIGGKTYQLREDYNYSNYFAEGTYPYNLSVWVRDADTLIVDEFSVKNVTPVTVSTDASGYATLYAGKQLYLPEGFTASTYNLANDTLTLSRQYSAADTLYTILPAYEAVVIKAAPSTTYTLEVSTDRLPYENDYGEFDEETWERIGGNSLAGVSDETDLTAWGDTQNYFYAPKEGEQGFGFYWANDKGEGFVAPANSVFLRADKTQTEKTYFLIDPTTATGINAVTVDANSSVNADLLNAPRYNLSGQRVGRDYKGIVVIKGHKYIVK